MVTTKRASYESNASAFSSGTNSGVQLLEKSSTKTYNTDSLPVTETLEETKLRMQRNLDKLLNYDRYTEEVENVSPVYEETQVVEEVSSFLDNSVDEDIRPSSTTMQFGDADLEQMYKEMNRASEQTSESYKLNTKGKIVVAIYAVIVTLIFALIVVNTGVLTVLSRANEVKASELAEKQAEFSALTGEIESISSNEYVLEVAQNELGMVKGN